MELVFCANILLDLQLFEKVVIITNSNWLPYPHKKNYFVYKFIKTQNVIIKDLAKKPVNQNYAEFLFSQPPINVENDEIFNQICKMIDLYIREEMCDFLPYYIKSLFFLYESNYIITDTTCRFLKSHRGAPYESIAKSLYDVILCRKSLILQPKCFYHYQPFCGNLSEVAVYQNKYYTSRPYFIRFTEKLNTEKVQLPPRDDDLNLILELALACGVTIEPTGTDSILPCKDMSAIDSIWCTPHLGYKKGNIPFSFYEPVEINLFISNWWIISGYINNKKEMENYNTCYERVIDLCANLPTVRN